MRRHVVIGILLLLFAVFVCAFGLARGAVRVVDDDWAGAPYSTIQGAINDSADGDVIRVYGGTYTENIVINRTVTLVGNGTYGTSIDGQGSGHVVILEANDVNMTGFTITGSGTGTSDAGINFGAAARFHMDNCTVDTNGGRNVFQNSDNRCVYDNCTFLNASNGLYIAYSSFNVVKNCTFVGQDEGGLFLYSAQYTIVSGCTFNSTGIKLWGQLSAHYNTHTVTDSTANGDPIYYYIGEMDLVVPTDAGQAFVVECDGAVVDGLDLSDTSTGVCVAYSDNVTVANMTLSGHHYPIHASHCNNLTVRNVTVTGKAYYGFYLEAITDSVITGCNLSLSSENIGIMANGDCSGLTMRDSTVSGAQYGVHTDGSNNTMTNMTVSDCSMGIYIRYGDSNRIEGCDIQGDNQCVYVQSDWNVISNNSLHGSTVGIYLYMATNCTVVYNEIFGNSGYGVYMATGTFDNVAHHNNIADNGGTSSQGYDATGDNLWDDGVSEGNYWDDWNGTGEYPIDGPVGGSDRYPLGDPVDTDAPVKVPGAGVLAAMFAAVLVFAVLRRYAR